MSNTPDKNIFLIEDNPDNALVIEDVVELDLRAPGHWSGIFQAFESGAQFFAFLEQNSAVAVDILLLDLQLPRANGYEVLAQLRAVPRLAETEVVALTANVMPDDVRRAEQGGFDHFIGKPLNNERFRNQLLALLNGEKIWQPR